MLFVACGRMDEQTNERTGERGNEGTNGGERCLAYYPSHERTHDSIRPPFALAQLQAKPGLPPSIHDSRSIPIYGRTQRSAPTPILASSY